MSWPHRIAACPVIAPPGANRVRRIRRVLQIALIATALAAALLLLVVGSHLSWLLLSRDANVPLPMSSTSERIEWPLRVVAWLAGIIGVVVAVGLPFVRSLGRSDATLPSARVV